MLPRHCFCGCARELLRHLIAAIAKKREMPLLIMICVHGWGLGRLLFSSGLRMAVLPTDD